MYSAEQLEKIVTNSAALLKVSIDKSGAKEIAKRSRGTPRVANRLLKRVRDYAQVKGNGIIDKDIADFALSVMEIDFLGLDNVDKAVLSTIIDKFGGGPVGIEAVASASNEDAATIEDVYEPYLIQLGFLVRTPRGRMCLPAAYKHLGKTPPSPLKQLTLEEDILGGNAADA
jgi:Holliday junction DNA helicase RuvB